MNEQKLIQGISRHLETMTEEELIMTLKYIHALKDFRKANAQHTSVRPLTPLQPKAGANTTSSWLCG